MHPRGHLQATGVDAAGRKQYLYHADWRTRRDQQKFDEMLEFAEALPKLRRVVRRDLAADGVGRERVLAAAVRLLDRGLFRIGSEDYADQNESYGLATLRKDHVTLNGTRMSFSFPAKSGQQRDQTLEEPAVVPVMRALKRRRGGSPELLAFQARPALGRRHLRGHQRLPEGGHGGRLLGQGLQDLERDRDRGRRARRRGADAPRRLASGA